MLSYEDICSAYERIKDRVYETPLDKSNYLSTEEMNVYLKLESLQQVKSFKLRGAFSKMTLLSEDEKERGVVAISSGNHGVAVSYAATCLGIDNVKIIVPRNTPDSKVDRIRYYGGQVIIEGDTYDDAHRYGVEYIKNHNMTEIDAYYNDKAVYAGQGTVGLEILKKNPKIDTILVPIGGGGLITGVSVAAKHINPDVSIIGVQPVACPAMLKSMEDDVFYEEYPSEPSICEALIGGVGKRSFAMSKDCIDEIVLVSEEYVRKGIAHVLKKEKFVVEPSSAICVGALLENPNRVWGSNVALVMSGGNLDDELMVDILTRD